MGISALVDYGLVTALAGLTYDERVGFVLGLEFAGQDNINPEKLAARAKVVRQEFHKAVSDRLIELNKQPDPPPTDTTKSTPSKPAVNRAELERELTELQAKAAKAQGEIGKNPHAVENIIRYGDRIKKLNRQLEGLK